MKKIIVLFLVFTLSGCSIVDIEPLIEGSHYATDYYFLGKKEDVNNTYINVELLALKKYMVKVYHKGNERTVNIFELKLSGKEAYGKNESGDDFSINIKTMKFKLKSGNYLVLN